MRPVIGITVNYSYNGDAQFAEGIGTKDQEWQMLADDYITAIVRGGGIPVLLPIVRSAEDMKALVSVVDGVLFSGGNDVDASYFGQRSQGKSGPIVPERDTQEAFLLKYVLEETNKPILGICRGIQLINAAMGGTLHQHLPDADYPDHSLVMYPRTMATHPVEIQPNSLLSGIVKTNSLPVNSYHHMAVDACAAELQAVARSEDGVIEALELKNNQDNRFFLAVQWHPEMMAEVNPLQQNILTAFVESCKR